MTTSIFRLGWVPALLGSVLAVACSGSTDAADDGTYVDNGFESDDPVRGADGSRGDYGSTAGSGGGTSSAGNEGSEGTDADRAIEEADIIKVNGDRLYTLSRYGGLAVIDISKPSKLKLISRKRLGGEPFEMYLRDNQAYVMLNDFGRYTISEETGYGSWVQTSEMLALDLSDPRDIREYASYDIPGAIADSRLVGDAVYVVTFENGYCWGCENNTPGTVVTSFNVSGSAITKVDQLEYRSEDSSYSWQRSVSATNERLYIAGPEYHWKPGEERQNSIIQVVDIRDPHGLMSKGADVPVEGQINSRWQMDEFDGVLRVVSQYGPSWGNNYNPKVQTFHITDSNTIAPLGETELILPKPETLRSVRFDGVRAYAITAEQTDPLYTIDLSEPSAPRQAAELHMPGWITHMEPRGERLVGFGYSDTTWGSPLAVSLFDVSDLENPQLLKRVDFGGGNGGYSEDQDRIHKSVQVLDDKGMVLVPFASYGNWNGDSCDDGQSGIQLIDYTGDDLVKRGVAPQYGQSRRALLVGNTLLGMSDRTVTAFDITDKDAPSSVSEVDLSNPTFRLTRIGNQIASITNDWWTGEAMLSLTPADNPDDATTTAKLSLAELAPATHYYCGGDSVWTDWYSARLFPMGDKLIVAVPVMTYDYNDSYSVSNDMIYGVVDVSNPAEAQFISKLTVPLGTSDYYGYYGCGGFFDGWGYWSFYNGSLLSDGESMVQVGSKLAYLANQYDLQAGYDSNGQNEYWTPVMTRKLHVVDFGDPSNPTPFAPIELSDSRGSTPLLVSGTQVLTSAWRQSPHNQNKVKFYVDRVDLGGNQPEKLSSVNTPGSLVSIDAASGRIVTVDYKRESKQMSSEECYANGNYYTNWYNYSTGHCESLIRTFHLSQLRGNGTNVTLLDSFLPPSQNLGAIKASEDRVYMMRGARYQYVGDRYQVTESAALFAIGGIRDGKLGIVSQIEDGVSWPLAASGNRIAVYTDSGFAVYDTSSSEATVLAKQTLRGYGYTSDVLLEDDRAVCSLGDYGMQTVPLK